MSSPVEVKRTPGGAFTFPSSPPTTPRGRPTRLNFDLSETKQTPVVVPPAAAPAPAEPSEEAKKLRRLAKFLVNAVGVAAESDLFKLEAKGADWEDYFDERYTTDIGKALADTASYGVDIWAVAAAGAVACTHFAALVNYHASWNKIVIKSAYRQKEASAYMQNRYEEALAYFKDVNL